MKLISEFINKVHLGDCLNLMKEMPAESVDCIVTDPPAGISFMGKKWDDDKGGRDQWIKWLSDVMREGLRVLKPGGHALVWSLPRTSHWTGMALENAGFEVRDIVHHVFGTGFPKSLDIGKAIDKLQGNERRIIGNKPYTTQDIRGGADESQTAKDRPRLQEQITKGDSKYEGWGTAIKPAVECWWLVRKPISENIIAENVLKYGTGGINIDGCRVPYESVKDYETLVDNYKGGLERATPETKENWTLHGGGWKLGKGIEIPDENKGRFPANLIHDGSDEVLAEFAKAGDNKGAFAPVKRGQDGKSNGIYGDFAEKGDDGKSYYNDTGTAARFFYCAKPSKSERDGGLENAKEKKGGSLDGGADTRNGKIKTNQPMRKNHHPTVKAQALMEYLIKLITPPNGIVLDMFAGSGSTLIAAKKLGHPYIGIEIDPEYCEIAKLRVGYNEISTNNIIIMSTNTRIKSQLPNIMEV